jgi:hypothetical protein
MDEDEMQDDAIGPGDPLQRQLARYARVRLEPNPAAMRRTRSAVMEAAWRRRIEAPAALPMPAPASARARATRVPFATWSARRLGSTVAAAVMVGLLVAGTVFAGSRAGGALYPARLVFEATLLPADPEARVQAELALAQTRLAEATQAAAAGDDGALEAALAAYGDMVEELGAERDGRADRALAAVELHLAVLLDLQARVPSAAAPAIERALQRSGGAIEKLEQAGGREPETQPGGGGAGSPATPAKPERTPRPERTPKPERTPRETQEPATTSVPVATPAPVKSEKPAKPGTPASEGEDEAGD